MKCVLADRPSCSFLYCFRMLMIVLYLGFLSVVFQWCTVACLPWGSWSCHCMLVYWPVGAEYRVQMYCEFCRSRECKSFMIAGTWSSCQTTALNQERVPTAPPGLCCSYPGPCGVTEPCTKCTGRGAGALGGAGFRKSFCYRNVPFLTTGSDLVLSVFCVTTVSIWMFLTDSIPPCPAL